MKIEIPLRSKMHLALIFEDAGKKGIELYDYYEVNMIMKRKDAGIIKIGLILKSDLKRLAKAS